MLDEFSQAAMTAKQANGGFLSDVKLWLTTKSDNYSLPEQRTAR
jgi:hypothetical protein